MAEQYRQKELPIEVETKYDQLKREAEMAIDEMTIDERIQQKRQWLSDISDLEMLCRLVDQANAADCVEVDLV